MRLGIYENVTRKKPIYHILHSHNDTNFAESLRAESNFTTRSRGIHTSTSYKWNNTRRTKCILRCLSSAVPTQYRRKFLPPTTAYVFIHRPQSHSHCHHPKSIIVPRSSLRYVDNLKLAAKKDADPSPFLPNVSIRFYLRCGPWFIVDPAHAFAFAPLYFPRTNPYGSVYREIYRSFQRTVDAT